MFEDLLPELLKDGKATGKKGTHTFTELKPDPSLKACFVDGGNAAVFESPSVRVEYVRLYGTVYEGKKRVGTKKEEGKVLVRNVVKDGQGYVEGKGYPPLKLELLIPDDDEQLRFGRERVSLGMVANLARFILECRFLKEMGVENDCDLLVRDGSLVGNNEYEERELGVLLETGKLVAGLSKTNTKRGKGGGSVTAELLESGPDASWLSPIGKEEGIDVSVVKLNEKSAYAFRLDTKGREEGTEDSERIASYLSSVSADPAFFGYPYPLVEADRMARNPNKELEALKMRFRAETGKGWKTLERQAHGTDAHGVLDRMG